MAELTLFDRFVFAWFGTFAALLCCWQIDEAQQPGQQYADPYLPCILMAFMFSPVLVMAWTVGGHIYQAERAKRRRQ